MDSMPAIATPAAGGIHPLEALRLLHSVKGGLLAQAVLHAQLAQVEWAEEKGRLTRMLATTLLGFACLLCALLFAGGATLALAWDTAYRIHAFAGLALLFGLGVVAARRRLRAWSALGDRSFAASREELSADAELMRACL